MISRRRWPVFVAGLAAGLGAAWIVPKFVARRTQSSAGGGVAARNAASYQCPMHPSIVSDKPGTCPICGMRLQRTGEEGVSAPRSGSKGRLLYYRHPMRPDVTSPVPAKDEMGMDYVPVYENESGGAESSVPDHAVVQLPQWRRQLIGVTTTKVARRLLTATIRTVGAVAYDPDLYNAVTEYREALATRRKAQGSAWPDVREGAEGLAKAAALKLKLMGLGEDQAARLAAEPAPTNLLYGRAGGTLWIYADVYESDAASVSVGQEIEATLPAFPGDVFPGTILAVDPVLNPDTRTVRVRAEIANPDGKLKPEMFVDVSIRVPLGLRLSVPVDAVLDTGTRQLVFVETSEGEFEPREIRIGRQADGAYEVGSGLREGEPIVTRANFLIDSESRLRATAAQAGKKAP